MAISEAVLYFLGGAWLWLHTKIASPTLFLIFVCIALSARALVLLLMFAIAARYRAERPSHMQIGPLRLLRLFFAEYAALLALYSCLQPFERWLPGTVDPDASGTGPPVVFIHGFLCNAGFWWALRRYLGARGCRRLHTVNLEPPFGDIERFAEQLHQRIESLRNGAGAAQFVLVAHSMGGLVARIYLRDWGHEKRVAKLVTLGTPHCGTVLARFLKGANVMQMRPFSPWLKGLNEAAPSRVPTVSIYSYHDNIVAPQNSSQLANANNIPLAGIGHLEMAFSRRVAELVYREILGDRRTTGG